MNKPVLVAVVAALALVDGVSVRTAHAQTTPGLCSQPNEHCVTVRIGRDSTGAPKASVDVPEVPVNGPNHVIFWRIENTGSQKYSFPDNGIAFKSATGKQEFTCGALGNSGIVFRCTDPNKAKGKFEYGVTVNGSPPVPPLDPWVINK